MLAEVVSAVQTAVTTILRLAPAEIVLRNTVRADRANAHA